MWTIRHLGTALLLVVGGAGLRGTAQTVTLSALQVTVRQDTIPGATPHFEVDLHNVSAHRLMLELGTEQGSTDAVRLFVQEQGGPLLWLQKWSTSISHNLEPVYVPLAPGKVLRVPVTLSEYFTMETRDWKLHLQPGKRYAMFAEFQGEGLDPKVAAKLEGQGVHLEPYVVGAVRSPATWFVVAR
ncbi:MAG: hypothetical protein ACRYFU_14650 [Janthinobacterium lividum]